MADDSNKYFSFFSKLAGLITTVTIIGGAYYYYRTNLWRPALKVISVDYDNGIAKVQVGKNNVVTIYKNQVVNIGGDFGLQFASDQVDGPVNRIELYKWPLTYAVIAIKP